MGRMGEIEQLTRSCDQASEPPSELAAKRSLKAQIAKLDRALSCLVVEGFPHIAPLPRLPNRGGDRPRLRGDQSARLRGPERGPRLLSLEQLETQRDALVVQLREVELATAARVEHERRARQLFEGMKLEPGRYRFYKLRAADLGEAGCGVWHVRPRLGLIGMLAGWWHLKLSSGCPLAKGRRPVRRPRAAEPIEVLCRCRAGGVVLAASCWRRCAGDVVLATSRC